MGSVCRDHPRTVAAGWGDAATGLRLGGGLLPCRIYGQPTKRTPRTKEAGCPPTSPCTTSHGPHWSSSSNAPRLSQKSGRGMNARSGPKRAGSLRLRNAGIFSMSLNALAGDEEVCAHWFVRMRTDCCRGAIDNTDHSGSEYRRAPCSLPPRTFVGCPRHSPAVFRGLFGHRGSERHSRANFVRPECSSQLPRSEHVKQKILLLQLAQPAHSGRSGKPFSVHSNSRNFQHAITYRR
jgi:hypothetical protein